MEEIDKVYLITMEGIQEKRIEHYQQYETQTL